MELIGVKKKKILGKKYWFEAFYISQTHDMMSIDHKINLQILSIGCRNNLEFCQSVAGKIENFVNWLHTVFVNFINAAK